MILIMKKSPLTRKIVVECSPHQYWGAWKKTQIFAKTYHLFLSTWTFF
jgi:hypothetical protein